MYVNHTVTQPQSCALHASVATMPLVLIRDLLRNFFSRGGGASGLRDASNLRHVMNRLLLSGDIKVDSLDSADGGLAALPKWVDGDGTSGAEDPEDTDRDPTGEERLAEDVTAAIHRHGPENKEGNGHEEGHVAGNLGSPLKHFLFLNLILSRMGLMARDELKIDVSSVSNIVVVGLADLLHALPVVLRRGKGVGENGDEDDRRQKSNNVASKHRIAAIY